MDNVAGLAPLALLLGLVVGYIWTKLDLPTPSIF